MKVEINLCPRKAIWENAEEWTGEVQQNRKLDLSEGKAA